MAEREIFRPKALEQLSSPEQLDQLITVVNRNGWFPLGILGAGLLLSIGWSIWGQIPINVNGTGVLLYPRQIVSFQMPASGQIVSIDVQVGDLVEKGQVLGAINQPELRRKLSQERLRLEEQLAHRGEIDPLRDEKRELERHALDMQRTTLSRLLDDSSRLAEALQQRQSAYEKLRSEGMSSEGSVLDARRNYLDSRLSIADFELRLRKLEVERARLEQQQLEIDSDSDLEVEEIRRKIATYEAELRDRGQIVSQHTGRVLEISSSAGELLAEGHRLGSIEKEDHEGELVAMVLFSIKDGKRLRKGMPIRVSPSTVQRERFGSILGEVDRVSRFPLSTDAVANLVGNREVARDLMQGVGKIEVSSSLVADHSAPSGFRWTSGTGPLVEITAGTTVQARVTLEYRRPITFIIPALRQASGT